MIEANRSPGLFQQKNEEDGERVTCEFQRL
jgi:hypothetical protein